MQKLATFMCSNLGLRSVAVIRRSAVEAGRLLHTRGWNGTWNMAVQLQQYSSARRYCPRNSNLATAIPRDQMLLSPTRAGGLVLIGRSFSSAPKVSTSTVTTTKLAVEGGVMTISLPLPGLPGLTAVSVPWDVPVREFISELMRLDER